MPFPTDQIFTVDGLTQGERLALAYWWAQADLEHEFTAPSGRHPDGRRMTPAECVAADLITHGISRTIRGARYVMDRLRARGLVLIGGRTVTVVDLERAVSQPPQPRKSKAKRATKRPEATTVLTSGPTCGPLFGDMPAETLTVDQLGTRPISEQVDGIFAEWDRLRIEAGRVHGKRPRPTERSVKRKREITRSIKEHGFDAVLAGLRFAGSEWARDRSDFESFSTTPFTENAIARAIGLARRAHQSKQWSRDANYGALARHGHGDAIDIYTAVALGSPPVDGSGDNF